MQHEDPDRPSVIEPDRAVAVFHRERELPRPSAAHASPDAGSAARGRRTPAPRCRATRRLPACAPTDLTRAPARPGLAANLATAWRDGPERARLGHACGPGAARDSGISTSRSAPTRCTDHSKRSTSVSVAASGRVKAGNAGADQQRRDGHVQPVERAGGEKARHGDAAALDEHAPQPARGQCGEHGGDVQPFARTRQAQHRRLADAVVAGGIGGAEQQGLRPVAEHAISRVQPAVGVEHHAHRRRPFAPRAWSAADHRRARCRRRSPRHRTARAGDGCGRCPPGPLIQCEAPLAVAMRPSSDCAMRPST